VQGGCNSRLTGSATICIPLALAILQSYIANASSYVHIFHALLRFKFATLARSTPQHSLAVHPLGAKELQPKATLAARSKSHAAGEDAVSCKQAFGIPKSELRALCDER